MSKKKKRRHVPAMKAPARRFWWRGTIVGIGRCDTPGCDCANEHDPAGAFAYTHGIHERLGLAELWLPAAARECSEMPVLPGYDLGPVLNGIAEGYTSGKYKPGHVVDIHNWPGGFVVAVRLEHECLEPDQLDCFRAHPDAQVRPLSWCAHRENSW